MDTSRMGPVDVFKKKHTWRVVLLSALFCISAFFTFHNLSSNPPIWYDEGMISQLAENVATHGVMGLQLAPGDIVSAGHVSTGFPFVIPVATSFWLFGVSVLSARLVAAFFLLALLAAAYALLRKLYSPSWALAGTALIATFSSLYGNGKSVLGEVPGLFFLFLSLFFFESLRESGYSKWIHGLLCGVCFGFCLATKPVFLVMGGAFVLAVFLKRRDIVWKKAWILSVLLAVFAIAAIWFMTQFSSSDSPRIILDFYANPYHLEHIGKVMLANTQKLFTESTPLYTLITFLIWGIALVMKKSRAIDGKHISFSEWAAFIFSTLVLIAYLRTPGWYRYLFPANIVILAFVPQALSIIFENMHIRRIFSVYAKYAAAAAVCALLIFQFYYLVFGSWISKASQQNMISEMQAFFAAESVETSFFVFDTPEVVALLPSQNYYQYFYANGVWEAGAEYLDVLKRGEADIVILDAEKMSLAAPFVSNYQKFTKIDKYAILKKI